MLRLGGLVRGLTTVPRRLGARPLLFSIAGGTGLCMFSHGFGAACVHGVLLYVACRFRGGVRLFSVTGRYRGEISSPRQAQATN